MTDRELMQQALDALEHLQTDIEWQYKSPTRAMLRKVEKELRALLAQGEPEPVAWGVMKRGERVYYVNDSRNVCQGYAELYGHRSGYGTGKLDHEVIPLYTAPPQREWVGLTDEEINTIAATPAAIPGSYVYSFARAIEQALKEKNA